METKTCTRCGIEKPLSEGFYMSKKSKDGRMSYCKECSKAAANAWYKANLERGRANAARWQQLNPEKVKAIFRKWTENNLEKVRARGREWYKNHPERVNASNVRWKMANREAVNRQARVDGAKRKALKLAYDGEHYTAADVKVLLEQQEGHCLYCYNRLDTYHVDHIVPLSRGGGNGKENIALACPSCNLSKHNRLLGLEWIPPYRADSSCFSGLNPVG